MILVRKRWLFLLVPLAVVIGTTRALPFKILIPAALVGLFFLAQRRLIRFSSKHLETCLAAFALGAALSGATAIVDTISFDIEWQAPSYGLTNYVEGTNSAFHAYGTTTLGTPQTNWPSFATITNWTLGPTDTFGTWHTSAVFTVPVGQYFISMTTSNANGETGLSSPDHNGPIPTSSVNLKLRHR